MSLGRRIKQLLGNIDHLFCWLHTGTHLSVLWLLAGVCLDKWLLFSTTVSDTIEKSRKSLFKNLLANFYYDDLSPRFPTALCHLDKRRPYMPHNTTIYWSQDEPDSAQQLTQKAILDAPPKNGYSSCVHRAICFNRRSYSQFTFHSSQCSEIVLFCRDSRTVNHQQRLLIIHDGWKLLAKFSQWPMDFRQKRLDSWTTAWPASTDGGRVPESVHFLRKCHSSFWRTIETSSTGNNFRILLTIRIAN